jgi:nucleotide-binding universal stress UspA family protein
MYRNILIPTDGSALSRKAVAAGVRLASALGAEVTGLFAAPPPTPLVYENLLPVGYMSAEQHAKLIAKTASKYLGVVEKSARAAGVKARCLQVTSDFPADAILATARKHRCDLIFMASHGRRGLAAVLLGSETQKVITHAKIPVLVHR